MTARTSSRTRERIYTETARSPGGRGGLGDSLLVFMARDWANSRGASDGVRAGGGERRHRGNSPKFAAGGAGGWVIFFRLCRARRGALKKYILSHTSTFQVCYEFSEMSGNAEEKTS